MEGKREDYEKLEKLDQAVDSIRQKFGADSILRASFLNQDNIDHMNGGISREKRTVDYSQIDLDHYSF